MNALDLHRSSVRFDEQSHTYTTSDGRQLTGVTSILKQALFPDKYKGIPETILSKAAERGTAIHNECEDVNLFGKELSTKAPVRKHATTTSYSRGKASR